MCEKMLSKCSCWHIVPFRTQSFFFDIRASEEYLETFGDFFVRKLECG